MFVGRKIKYFVRGKFGQVVSINNSYFDINDNKKDSSKFNFVFNIVQSNMRNGGKILYFFVVIRYKFWIQIY